MINLAIVMIAIDMIETNIATVDAIAVTDTADATTVTAIGIEEATTIIVDLRRSRSGSSILSRQGQERIIRQQRKKKNVARES